MKTGQLLKFTKDVQNHSSCLPINKMIRKDDKAVYLGDSLIRMLSGELFDWVMVLTINAPIEQIY